MELFLITAPGLEPFLADEAREIGLDVTGTIPGGVLVNGDWSDVRTANIQLRGATRVLARLSSFRAMHLAQLDKRSRKLPWAEWLLHEIPFRVEATCRKSRIYHDRAAAQRVTRAVTETLGAPYDKNAEVVLKVRIEDDLCTISVDTSGPSLHKRGIKEQVNKAPMRETLASLFLRACGFSGDEPVYDPMCGSGTFVIEAAEMALGLAPGRQREFAFSNLACATGESAALPALHQTTQRFYGSDRDQGAIAMSRANATRAGLSEVCNFECRAVGEIVAPCSEPGLVIVNPPYGKRIGNKGPLYGLYASLGERLKSEFAGWRVGLLTSEPGLARATDLDWAPPGPRIDHGGVKIQLWQAQL